MGRKPVGKVLNTSIVTNSSILETADSRELEHAEFIKKFGWPDLDTEDKIKLIGNSGVIETIRDKIETLLNSEPIEPKFALITGPSGTGKTNVIRKLANEYGEDNRGDQSKNGLTFFYLKASWIMRKQFGNPEQRIRLLFDEAIQKAPSLVFIDKIDSICTEKKSQNESKDRLFDILEDELDKLIGMSARVMVLAATDRPEMLDPQIRKPCYFSDEIRFSLPSSQDRIEILKFMTSKYKINLSDQDFNFIANATHCYSFRDLRKLCDIAIENSSKFHDGILNKEAFQHALNQFKPFAISSITTPCPPLRWTDIGGVENVKKELQVSVIWPLKHRDKFTKFGIGSRKGAILYGPPGCSKTMLAQALATESGYNFIAIDGPELINKWVGESEAAIRKLYRNAREIAPCIIFFDEIDGFAATRSGGGEQSSPVGERVVTQLLTEFNKIGPLDNVFTIAATNRPDRVDSALLRPGRLDAAIYIPLPSENDRREIFKVHMKKLPSKFDEPSDAVIDKLASRTPGYTGAEIANLCWVAATSALLENIDSEFIEWRHFEDALEKVKPRTNAEHLKSYEKFQDRMLRFGRGTNITPPSTASLFEEKQHSTSTSSPSSLTRLMKLMKLRSRQNSIKR